MQEPFTIRYSNLMLFSYPLPKILDLGKAVTNALAYYGKEYVTPGKSFMKPAPGILVCLLHWLKKYLPKRCQSNKTLFVLNKLECFTLSSLIFERIVKCLTMYTVFVSCRQTKCHRHNNRENILIVGQLSLAAILIVSN
jgi:hypothetical protein